MATNPPTDNSSLIRKVSVPVVAGAVTILVVIGLHTAHAPISVDDYAVGAPALATVLTFLGDIFLPARFLA